MLTMDRRIQSRFYQARTHLDGRWQQHSTGKQWELRNGDRVLVSEFRDDEQAGAGVHVQVLENGELLLSQRCITGDAARYVSQVFKQDHLRQGWTEVPTSDS